MTELETVQLKFLALQTKYESLLRENEQLKRWQQKSKKIASKRNNFKRPTHQLDAEKIPTRFQNSYEKPLVYSKDQEIQRRQLHNTLMELYFYITSAPIANRLSTAQQERLQAQLVFAIANSFKFGNDIDGAWEGHSRTLELLQTKIQARIHALQNPPDCFTAKLLVCQLDKPCGFGCQIHHVAYCLMVAVIENRTMVFEGDGTEWRYSPAGWTAAFEPISNCSLQNELSAGDNRFGKTNLMSQTERIIHQPVLDWLKPKPMQLPLSIPTQIADHLLAHHSNPPVFMVSQFLRYAMRENGRFQKIIDDAEAKVPFNAGPVVGLHIRRTDKIGTEADFHPLDEYMKWAEFWFRVEEKRRGLPNGALKRRVFIATDDRNVVSEAKNRYGDTVDVYSNDGVADTAQLSSRYTEQSLAGLLSDIRLLAKCDYIVCTYSSRICRVVFELHSGSVGNMAERIHSLDDIYYFAGQHDHNWEAVEDYEAKNENEISIRKGDTIGIAGNYWNGSANGRNKRVGDGKVGLFPGYVAREQWRIVDFPFFNGIFR